ncbi:ferric-chelate reductase [Niveomyces insectorum RCEF 264]|uniref:ferric-chelate reductase (NADPH) n=1 Tax=Niveomyces insectorum RCEF 264 TaxID=1081102 RepID=A0A167RVB7_9HYPO|nr:ferric-chelate reductase [Niveomyces insectorum RCEF 264]
MSGMDMGSMDMGVNMFQVPNMALARTYWYTVAGVVGLFVAIRLVNYYDNAQRLRTRASSAKQFPTQPRNRFWQVWATLTAVSREMSYPQVYVPVRYLTWLTPPPAGRLLVLFIYWGIIIGFMCANAIIFDANFWERIGFRNAWVTVTQLPLLYLLAGKTSVVGTLTGVSHERLSWMHRWIARTMFVTASVHGWHFYTEYARAGQVDIFFEMMPMGKYGFAAWGLLGWSFLVGMAPLRHLCYEVFVIQHIAVAVLLLWVLYLHVPAYARYNVWFAIAALCLDRAVRLVLLVWQNVKVRPNPSRCKGGQRIGHQAQIRAVGDDITVVTIKDVHFRWRAGQHLYLWMPWIGPFEQHPYTIACAHQVPGGGTCICNSIQLVVRKHGGFSKRLHDRAVKLRKHGSGGTGTGTGNPSFTAFVTGPLGEPPRWDVYETLVLISASTGASFTLPILESVLQTKRTVCTKRVDFLLAAKKGDEIDYYVQRLHELIDLAKDVGIELTVHIALTGNAKQVLPSLAVKGGPQADHAFSSSSSLAAPSVDAAAAAAAATNMDEKKTQPEPVIARTASSDVEKLAPAAPAAAVRGAGADAASGPTARLLRQGSTASNDSHVYQLDCRPDIGAFIRAPVEATGGETAVVVCGGKSLVARTRNCVAKLSDERAVHKGTGAQGIYLHVEEYNF